MNIDPAMSSYIKNGISDVNTTQASLTFGYHSDCHGFHHNMPSNQHSGGFLWFSTCYAFK